MPQRIWGNSPRILGTNVFSTHDTKHRIMRHWARKGEKDRRDLPTNSQTPSQSLNGRRRSCKDRHRRCPVRPWSRCEATKGSAFPGHLLLAGRGRLKSATKYMVGNKGPQMCFIADMLKAWQRVCAIVQLDPRCLWAEPVVNRQSRPSRSLWLIPRVSFPQSKSPRLRDFILHLVYK